MSTISALAGTPAETPAAAAGGASSGVPGALNAAEMGDRFLKLLITQLKNQDPLNPMDNAQLTSQMAQINTVSGIEKLNSSVKGLGTQFLQSQAMQGAAMIGRQAWTEGDRLVAEGGVARAGFELAGAAGAVKVEVLGPSGQLLDTLNLGAQAAGRGRFEWKVPGTVDPASLRFRVSAASGAQAVPATALSIDTVSSVSTTADGLSLGLARLGQVDFAKVKAVSS
jgi:flagellar basal-body rod modification protein FlgD